LDVERFALIGFSCGGSHALTLAAVAPERVFRVVAASTQVPDEGEATEGLDADPDDVLAIFRTGRTAALEAIRAERRQGILRDPLAGYEKTVPAFSAREHIWYNLPWVRDVYVENLREAFRKGIEGDVEDCLGRIEPFDVDLSRIACPVRAVHGGDDDWTPLRDLNRVLAGIGDTKVVILDGMKHFGPLLFPDLLVSLACDTSG
ncbi:MAG: alpha/beta hydrolase, partial [Actinomycetota bacterium]|nr:alpha/beta hydrolase [Actinomycetota bacterium]